METIFQQNSSDCSVPALRRGSGHLDLTQSDAGAFYNPINIGEGGDCIPEPLLNFCTKFWGYKDTRVHDVHGRLRLTPVTGAGAGQAESMRLSPSVAPSRRAVNCEPAGTSRRRLAVAPLP